MNIKKLIYYIGIIASIFSFISCDNDDGNTPNQNTCECQGVTFFDNNDNKELIAESDLFTDFFNTSGNEPEVEIYERNNPGNFNFTTTKVDVNGTVLEY